jgi:rRNA maturation endonuclease Nob1
MEQKTKSGNTCTACGKSYSKRDYHVCPYCGGDGGGVMVKGWRPDKYQKKAFSEKMRKQESKI